MASQGDSTTENGRADDVLFDDEMLDAAMRNEAARATPPRWFARRSGRVAIGVAVGATALLVLVATLNWNARREALEDLGAVPFAIVATLPIAANSAADDRSILWLVCTGDRQIVLALKTRLAVGREFYATGQEGDAALFVDGLRNRIETRMRLVDRSRYDLLVSSRLSGTAVGAISGFFGNDTPRQVSIVALETDTKLTGQVAKGQIASFAASCR